MELIINRLKNRLDGATGAEAAAYRDEISSFDGITLDVQAFVASFSAEGDLLSQWMAYSGGSDSGYAIGVSSDQFETAIAEGFALVRCVYEEAKQIELADAFIDVICEPSGANRGDENIAKARRAFLVAAAMKHPGFEQEAEWRLIKIAAAGLGELTTAQFRQGRNGLVPYLEAPLCPPRTDFVPKFIHIGPTNDMEAGSAAVRALLDSRGLWRFLLGSNVDVLPSATPYRP